MLSKDFIIKNKSGLHVRPAGVLVKTIQPFSCSVTIKHKDKDKEYNAKSVMSVMGACIKAGNEITVCVNGEDEEECLKAIETIIESGLGE